MKKVIYIVGPTASGKTGLGVEVAKKYNGEIISADSMQIYKGIHIASAAPDEQEMQGIPHHLIEILPSEQQFSVAEYVNCARIKINDIINRGKTPIVVGGTGLYINSLTENIKFIDENTNQNIRKNLEKQYDELGGEVMLKKLSEFDKDTAIRLHPNNRRRIIRAFEVFSLTGKTITEQNFESKNGNSDYSLLILGITFKNRELLYNRINKRVDNMIENGLVDEAKLTYGRNYTNGAFQAIGHKELYKYLNNECSLGECVEKLKQSTRRYAKRQLTWFRRDERINWLYADEENIQQRAFKIIADFLGKDEYNEK